MNRLYIILSEEERAALQTMADHERRDPRVQAALLIRHGLEHASLLPTRQRLVTSENAAETEMGRQPDARTEPPNEL